MADVGEEAGATPARPRGVAGLVWMMEHAQDYASIAVGVVLLLLAAVLIVAGVAGFFGAVGREPIQAAATGLVDQVLLVLILVEIVHTVVLSLRAHRLAAQPFIVVGLIAVIRRILLLLSSESKVNVSELGILIAMVVAFVAGLIAVSRFEKQQD